MDPFQFFSFSRGKRVEVVLSCGECLYGTFISGDELGNVLIDGLISSSLDLECNGGTKRARSGEFLRLIRGSSIKCISLNE